MGINQYIEKRKIMYSNQSEDAIIQNLIDAGCDIKTIQKSWVIYFLLQNLKPHHSPKTTFLSNTKPLSR